MPRSLSRASISLGGNSQIIKPMPANIASNQTIADGFNLTFSPSVVRVYYPTAQFAALHLQFRYGTYGRRFKKF
jgi:hypothetical protein